MMTRAIAHGEPRHAPRCPGGPTPEIVGNPDVHGSSARVIRSRDLREERIVTSCYAPSSTKAHESRPAPVFEDLERWSNGRCAVRQPTRFVVRYGELRASSHPADKRRSEEITEPGRNVATAGHQRRWRRGGERAKAGSWLPADRPIRKPRRRWPARTPPRFRTRNRDSPPEAHELLWAAIVRASCNAVSAGATADAVAALAYRACRWRRSRNPRGEQDQWRRPRWESNPDAGQGGAAEQAGEFCVEAAAFLDTVSEIIVLSSRGSSSNPGIRRGCRTADVECREPPGACKVRAVRPSRRPC